jgi:hypothetical protein
MSLMTEQIFRVTVSCPCAWVGRCLLVVEHHGSVAGGAADFQGPYQLLEPRGRHQFGRHGRGRRPLMPGREPLSTLTAGLVRRILVPVPVRCHGLVQCCPLDALQSVAHILHLSHTSSPPVTVDNLSIISGITTCPCTAPCDAYGDHILASCKKLGPLLEDAKA